MLAAMFSGKYSVVLDKDGRYFIDADGDCFVHILNYLRYGDIPKAAISEYVYREAAYFGLHGLMQELEKHPQILAKIQRHNLRSQYPGYSDCMDSIIKSAGCPATKETLDVNVLLFKNENEPGHDEFNINHMCLCKLRNLDKTVAYDAKLGPWKHDSSEKDVLNCIVYDLESLGFTITSRYLGTCIYQHETIECKKAFYAITFHWWK
ncbi:hypothetical protein DPMN_073273 [Dreissena polymorpha]|nr:hypothetical protein DPMN_073273 [Dreissena polymorpha]